MDKKKELRRKILACRDALLPHERHEKSELITERILAWPAYQEARTVLLYAGVRSEVETEALTRQSLKAGKRVLMPRCVPATRDLILVPIQKWEELERGFFGLLEPPLPTTPIAPEEPDLVVVPGVAFDADGFRLGYGGGYYDRLLRRLGTHLSVALAFELQLVPRVPRAAHDLPVAYVATEKRLIASRVWQSYVEALVKT